MVFFKSPRKKTAFRCIFCTLCPYASLHAIPLRMRSRHGRQADEPRHEQGRHTKLTEFFNQLLPSVRSEVVDVFVCAIQDYHDAFDVHRQQHSDYENSPEYRVASHRLLSVKPEEDLWVYSPYFKKIMAFAIGQLFNTRITGISTSSSFETWQTAVFVNADRVRWTVAMQPEGEAMHISLMYPISDTRVDLMHSLRAEKLTQELTRPGGLVLKVNDISGWGLQPSDAEQNS
jgi:hypothetical protein